MCQGCVDKGLMTQQELDEEILSGNTDVMSLMDLPPALMAAVVTKLCLDLIQKDGWSLNEALAFGHALIDGAILARAESEDKP